MDLESMLTVFYAILLSTLGLGDAQMAFPKVAYGKKAVARVFRGAVSSTVLVTLESCARGRAFDACGGDSSYHHGLWVRLRTVPLYLPPGG